MTADIEELARWDAKIQDLALAYGLDCFEQEFELCDHHEMLGYMAYSGMPARYPHWSYGKSYERQKTLYDYGVSGLPYEMVINADPSLAYLMADNSTCLNVLTIAHVYGHNDFFKNNLTFSTTRPEFTIEMFKTHADRVRGYVEDPSIGIDRVESILDAAHALSLQCRRNQMIRKLAPDAQAERLIDAAAPREDPYRSLHTREEVEAPDLHRVPLEPEEDLLLFLRDYNPYLADWERDLLTIVDEETRYFLPQIETKIMNEGWASYWHYQIMTNVGLPEELYVEFAVHHNQVIRPHPGGLNPYHVGFKVWEDLYRRIEGDEPPDHRRATAGRDALYSARESERDSSFLRRFLTEDLARRLGLFEFRERRGDTYVTEVADEPGFEQIRDTLVASVGMGGVPVLRIVDADGGGHRGLVIEHAFDGRELKLEDAEKTLGHLHRLWGHEVSIRTKIGGKKTTLLLGDDGFEAKSAA